MLLLQLKIPFCHGYQWHNAIFNISVGGISVIYGSTIQKNWILIISWQEFHFCMWFACFKVMSITCIKWMTLRSHWQHGCALNTPRKYKTTPPWRREVHNSNNSSTLKAFKSSRDTGSCIRNHVFKRKRMFMAREATCLSFLFFFCRIPLSCELRNSITHTYVECPAAA